jgi:hypothetical protein
LFKRIDGTTASPIPPTSYPANKKVLVSDIFLKNKYIKENFWGFHCFDDFKKITVFFVTLTILFCVYRITNNTGPAQFLIPRQICRRRRRLQLKQRLMAAAAAALDVVVHLHPKSRRGPPFTTGYR